MSSDMNSNDDDLKALALFLDAEIEGNPTTTEKITDHKQGECIIEYLLVLDVLVPNSYDVEFNIIVLLNHHVCCSV